MRGGGRLFETLSKVARAGCRPGGFSGGRCKAGQRCLGCMDVFSMAARRKKVESSILVRLAFGDRFTWNLVILVSDEGKTWKRLCESGNSNSTSQGLLSHYCPHHPEGAYYQGDLPSSIFQCPGLSTKSTAAAVYFLAM